MNKYRRVIKLGQKKDYSKIWAILFLCVFAFVSFSYVNQINKRDQQIMDNYESLCGSDYEDLKVIKCLSDVYYQYND